MLEKRKSRKPREGELLRLLSRGVNGGADDQQEDDEDDGDDPDSEEKDEADDEDGEEDIEVSIDAGEGKGSGTKGNIARQLTKMVSYL